MDKLCKICYKTDREQAEIVVALQEEIKKLKKMISNTQQKVDKEKYDENFDRIFNCYHRRVLEESNLMWETDCGKVITIRGYPYCPCCGKKVVTVVKERENVA